MIKTYNCSPGESITDMCRLAEDVNGLPAFSVRCDMRKDAPDGCTLVGWASVRPNDPRFALYCSDDLVPTNPTEES